MPYKTLKDIKESAVHSPGITVRKTWRERFAMKLRSAVEIVKNRGPITAFKISVLAAIDRELLVPVVAFFGMSTVIDYCYETWHKPKAILA
jgi:predicted glycosyltransferase